MANESIRLTFSEDGEHIQLSRLDAAMLLTWILGGDHDADIPETAFNSPAAAPLFGGVEFEVPAFGHEDATAKAEEFVPQAVFERVQEIWDEDEVELPPEETLEPIAPPKLLASSARHAAQAPVDAFPEPALPVAEPAGPERHLVAKPVVEKTPPVEIIDPGDFWTQPTPEEKRIVAPVERKPNPETAIPSFDPARDQVELPGQEEKPYWEIEDEEAPVPPVPPLPRRTQK